MADVYLRSTDGDDGDDGSTWALAKATLQSALTAAGAGGTVYMADGHSESITSPGTTITSPGTAGNITRVICVDDTSDPEPPTARAITGTLNGTGSSDISLRGHVYLYGVQIKAGDQVMLGDVASASQEIICDNCLIENGVGGGADQFIIGPSSNGDEVMVELIDCDIVWTTNAGYIRCSEHKSLVISGGTIAATGAVPSILFDSFSNEAGSVLVKNVDLVNFGSGDSLIDAGSWFGANVEFVDCKVGSSVAFVTGATGGRTAGHLLFINVDSGDTNYRYERYTYPGTETSETTIVLDASDDTTTFSRKMVTTANSAIESPMRSLPVTFWNETVGSSQTATIEIVTDNITLQDDEAWIEVEYLGTSGFPLGLHTSDRLDDFVFGTPANQTTSSASWTTTGLSTPVKQKLEVAFTAEEKGLIRVTVHLAKPSTTMYYNPKIDIS